jgi:hypothetical protein
MITLMKIDRVYPLKGGPFCALHDISLDIRERDFVSISQRDCAVGGDLGADMLDTGASCDASRPIDSPADAVEVSHAI